MGNWLGRLYGSLPVVRELRQLQQTVRAAEETHAAVRAALAVLQDDAVARLRQQDRYRDPRRLAAAEHQVYSQHGEDGIIAEIFRRVGTTNRYFVEIGVGNGLENNTTYLLQTGWTGSWVEGSPESASLIRDRFGPYLADGRLRLVSAFVTRENVAELLADGPPDEPDLLSIDIDYNTYWAWEGLRRLRPRVVIVEYNATLPPDIDWKVEYSPDRVWDGSFYFGASLKAFEQLGRDHGYALVGCDLSGTNAFFVRSELVADRFHQPFTADNHYEPARYYLNRRHGHPSGL